MSLVHRNRDRVEDFAARGPGAYEVIPGSFPKLTTPSGTHETATGAWNAAARIGFRLETARRVGRHFCLLLEEIGSLTRVMGGALLGLGRRGAPRRPKELPGFPRRKG
jgi:hypothetical protein